MAEVITRLKVDNSGYDQKIKSAQRSLDQFGLKGTEVGQKMSGLTQMLNVNIGALSKWSVGLAAAGTALKVAGDAMKSNEANLDEWGRITEASKSVYDGFLKALNTGSIDSYLSNIRSIISAARDAYDALDELGTFQAFNQVNQARNKAGYAAALDAFKLDPSETNRQALKEANEKVLADLKQEAEYAQNAYEKTLKQIAKENGMNTDEQQKAFMELFQGKSYAELLNAKAGFKHNRIGRDEYNGQSVTEVYGLGRYVDANGSIVRDMTAEENAAYKLAKALSALTDEEIREFQAKGMLAYNLQEAAATQDRSYNRLAGNTKTSTTTTVKAAKDETKTTSSTNLGQLGVLKDQAATIQNSFKFANSKEELDEMKAKLEEVLAQIRAIEGESATAEIKFEYGSLDHLNQILRDAQDNLSRLKIGSEEWEAALEDVNIASDAVAAAQSKTGGVAETTASGTGNAWSAAASAISSAGSALQSIEDPGAKVAGIVGQAVANIALGFAQAAASPATGAAGVFGWIAAATAGIATMTATIASIKSATAEYHADGGFIGGPRGTDVTPMWGTPGELVLNRAQQNNLAGQLQGASSGMGNMTLRTEISGENLAIVLDNNNRRRGRSKSVR